MGKKVTGKRAAGGDKAEGPKVTKSADWKKSKCTGPMLTALSREGLLGPKESNTWRVPGGESSPTPARDERIAFVDFIPRGVSFPLHPFFAALLCALGVQLHDLTPNSVQHVACFIVLCECYLGIAPHWTLFKRIFRMKAQPSKENPHQIGGCNIQVKEPNSYLSMGFLESVIGWKYKWFYAKDTENKSNEPLVNLEARVVQRASWRGVLTLEEISQTDDYLHRIEELKNAGLTGVQLSSIFLKRRVQPLRTRSVFMWEYRGTDDVLRLRADELSSTELDTFLRQIIKPSEVKTTLSIEPFSTANPPPAVSSHFTIFPN